MIDKKQNDRQNQEVNELLNGFNDYLTRHWDEFVSLLNEIDDQGHIAEEWLSPLFLLTI